MNLINRKIKWDIVAFHGFLRVLAPLLVRNRVRWRPGTRQAMRQNKCVIWHIFQTKRNQWNVPGIRHQALLQFWFKIINVYQKLRRAMLLSMTSQPGQSQVSTLHGLWLDQKWNFTVSYSLTDIQREFKVDYPKIPESKMIVVLSIYPREQTGKKTQRILSQIGHVWPAVTMKKSNHMETAEM